MSLLVASARILRADNGAEVACDELHRTGERPLVWSLDERKRLVARQRNRREFQRTHTSVDATAGFGPASGRNP